MCSGRVCLSFILLLVLCHGDGAARKFAVENNSPENDSGSPSPESSSTPSAKKGTIAEKVEGIVKKEFAEDVREAEETIGSAYNETAQSGQASMETVVRFNHKQRVNVNASAGEVTSNNASATNHTSVVKPTHEIESDVDRMIDSRDNEFVLSKPKELAALTLDAVFIQDLTILYTSAAIMGVIFETVGQPVINGYFVAGSLVGTGGFMLIQELVQVQSLAQLGVQLLLFHLGLEFSLTKMHSVGGIAFVGGLLEMCAFIALSLAGALVTGADARIGAFIGALISLSSTSVVANCLESTKSSQSQYGRITIGTLILQDCTVGLMFATMPLLGQQKDDSAGESPLFPMLLSLSTKLLMLALICTFVSRNILPPLIKRGTTWFSQDLFQILLFSYCCLCAMLTGKIGLSHELGAFVAGCMLSSSSQTPKATKAIEGARNIFMTLFMASIGLMISPSFMWEHIGFLTLGVIAVILCKTTIITVIVRSFRYDMSTSMLVGLSLAQISEFAFVLLSVAVDYHLLKVEMYLLLVGVTGLSLLCTPIIISLSRSFLYRPEEIHKRVSTRSDTDDEDALTRLNKEGDQKRHYWNLRRVPSKPDSDQARNS